MKQVFAIIAVVVFTLPIISCNNNQNKPTSTEQTHSATTPNAGTLPMVGKIAFLNIDTFEAHYKPLQTKRAEFEKRQKAIEEELARTERQIAKDYQDLQQKAQTGNITQAEGEAAQQRLMKMSQDFDNKRSKYSEQLYNEQTEFNTNLRKTLEDYLKSYNEDKGYDYILTDGTAGMILLANPSYDITQDVIDGMNKLANGSSATSTKADSTN
jgi:outer membrane protein